MGSAGNHFTKLLLDPARTILSPCIAVVRGGVVNLCTGQTGFKKYEQKSNNTKFCTGMNCEQNPIGLEPLSKVKVMIWFQLLGDTRQTTSMKISKLTL